MSDPRIRRGITFAGFALILSILIMPLALNVVSPGPVSPTVTSILWVVIAVLTAVGFYMGYSGWGRR